MSFGQDKEKHFGRIDILNVITNQINQENVNKILLQHNISLRV